MRRAAHAAVKGGARAALAVVLCGESEVVELLVAADGVEHGLAAGVARRHLARAVEQYDAAVARTRDRVAHRLGHGEAQIRVLAAHRVLEQRPAAAPRQWRTRNTKRKVVASRAHRRRHAPTSPYPRDPYGITHGFATGENSPRAARSAQHSATSASRRVDAHVDFIARALAGDGK